MFNNPFNNSFYNGEKIFSMPHGVVDELERDICRVLDKIGIFYRIFSRVKSENSIIKKLNIKNYSGTGKKMQDLLGVRIGCYFLDDISISCNIIKSLFTIVDESKDVHDPGTFKPSRLNYVCKLPDNIIELIPDFIWSNYPIDMTFEIQFRTIFSEGWHEIDHDLRYKNPNAWSRHNDLSRNLNGILATLETCDWSIMNIFDEMAYRNYQNGDWENMIRNRYRMRIREEGIDNKICNILNEDKKLAKNILQGDRNELFLLLSSMNIPLKINNIIYCINELFINNTEIRGCTPKLIIDEIGKTTTNRP